MIIDNVSNGCVKDLEIHVGDVWLCHDEINNDIWQEIILSFRIENAFRDEPLRYVMYCFCPNDGYSGERFAEPTKTFDWLKHIVRTSKEI